jgi:hypothetical protein
MQRPQLEHIIRAAAGITGAPEIVVIGSQAVLGEFPNAPAELLVSIEADVFTFRDPADADLIDGSIGASQQTCRSEHCRKPVASVSLVRRTVGTVTRST